MTIYDVLEKYAEIKASQDGKKYDYSRARLKDGYTQFVNLWKSYYRGDVEGIHKINEYNGDSFYEVKRRSMRLAKIIAQKWACGLFSEAFKITLTNDSETEKFRQLEKIVDFRSKLNQAAIHGYSEGTCGLLASAVFNTNTETGAIVDGKPKLDVIKFDSLFPLVFDQNDITSIAFVRQEQIKDTMIYTIAIHNNENGQATVETITARVKGETVNFTAAETVKQSQVFNNPMYCIVKPNTINDYSDVLPFGQSIFADALAPCVDVDLAADALRRDIEESPQITFVGRDLLLEKIGNDGAKKKLFENARRRFFTIPQPIGEQGTNVKQLFEKSVPQIRVQQFWEAIKNSLNWATMTSGLGKNTLDIIPQQTATGVIHTEAEKMQNVSLHQQYLEGQIIKIVRALCELSAMTGSPIDASEVSITWEDNVIQDTTTEKNLAMREVDMGVMTKEEYRVRFYGETLEEAGMKIEGMKSDTDNFDFMRE